MKTLPLLIFAHIIYASVVTAQVTWLSPTQFGPGNLHAAAMSGTSSIICGAGQLLYSTGGEPFRKAQTPVSEFTLNDVAVLFGNIFIAVGENGIILRSTDNGASWIQVADFASTLNRCAAVVGNGTAIAIGRNGLVVRSADAGETWTTYPSFTGEDLRGLSVTGLSVMVAGAGGTIALSTDGGASWNAKERVVDDDIGAVALLSPQFGFIGGTSGNLYFSADGGASWRSVFVDTNFSFINIRFLTNQIGYALGANGRIAKTTNSGASWSVVELGQIGFLRDVFGTENSITLIGDAGTTAQSTDGGSNWTATLPPTAKRLFRIRYDNSQTLWAAGNNGEIISQNGSEWKHVNSPTRNAITALDVSEILAIGVETGDIFLSKNRGSSWVKADSGGRAIGGIARFSGGEFIAVGIDGKIRRSTDGNVWQDVLSPTSHTLTSVCAVDAKIGIATGDSGIILRTTDAGTSWNAIQVGNHALISATFSDSKNGFAVGDRGQIFHTSDAGTNWEIQDSPDNTLTWTAISFDRTTKGGILVSLEGDIYATYNGGDTWKNIAKVGTICLDGDFRSNLAAVCGGSGGIFTVSGVVSVEEAPAFASFSAQLSPLPAESSAEIKISSQIMQNVVVSIIATDGKVVFSRYFEAAAGNSILRLDCGSFPAGTYRCRIASGTSAISLPLVLIR
ncbi:hypothetical protein MASR2M18_20380 [Ignavibacteria bacterium]|nr:hypothetical protein [Bacteroidota bacterium]MCZ2131774.1 hypothetical protein [Bacteroidota bacterium]